MSLPSFLKDDSESMKFEEVIDFFISWTIRCADINYADKHKTINNYSKIILSKLIYNDETIIGNKVVSNIKIWKQYLNVDLWVELEIDTEKIVMIIENKMYSSIRKGQLEKYKKIAIEYYKDQNDIKIYYIFLRPDYEIDRIYKEKNGCEELGYLYLNIEELQSTLPKNQKSNNALFDEFWFNWK